MTDQIAANQTALVEAGWNADVAEALAKHLSELDLSPMEVVKTYEGWTAEQIMDVYLTWNGIIGYTKRIINAVDNCRNMEAA